jgi:hypothetical protein
MVETFSGGRVRQEIEAICALGPRVCGSAGLDKLRDQIRHRFDLFGGTCRTETFPVPCPSGLGPDQQGTNLIASLGPNTGPRLLLGTHFDTRPRAEEEVDPARQLQPIIGANDGASGVAVLLELARLAAGQAFPRGIDFVFFDAEEYVFDPEIDPLVVGSLHFAGQLPDPQLYPAAVMVDIVGRQGQILRPDFDAWYLARPLVDEIWDLAAELSPDSFEKEVRYEVLDDHLPLLGVGIPAVCLIDVEDPRWHTLDDLPEHCDPTALEEVGRVLWHWLGVKMSHSP